MQGDIKLLTWDKAQGFKERKLEGPDGMVFISNSSRLEADFINPAFAQLSS